MRQNKLFTAAAMAFFAVIAVFTLISFSDVASAKRQPYTINQVINDTGGVDIPAGNTIGYKMWSNSPFFINQPDSSFFLYLEAKAAKHTASTAQRVPLNIALVLDRSGSMMGDKLEYCKKAAQFVVDNLDADDRVSVVIYESGVKVLVPSTKAGNKEQLKRMIAGINVAGGTCMSCGMLSGYDEVKKYFEQQHVNRVLLLTDGLANEGISDAKRLDSVANKWATSDRITLSTFGVGADFDEKMLTNLAEYGIGNYYFIDKPENIPPIFSKEMKGLLEVVAQEASVKLELPPNVTVVKVYGYRFEQKGNTLIIPFRDIFSEELKSVLVELKLKQPQADPLVFKSAFTFNDAVANQKNAVINSDVILMPTVDYAMMDKNTDDYVLQQVTIFKSNDLLEEAMDKADKGDFEGAAKVISANETYLSVQKAKVKYSSPSFRAQDSLNINYKKRLAEAKTMNATDFKMYQKTNRSDNYKGRKKKS
jgi:Ca-activated chloride channel homolog